MPGFVIRIKAVMEAQSEDHASLLAASEKIERVKKLLEESGLTEISIMSRYQRTAKAD